MSLNAKPIWCHGGISIEQQKDEVDIQTAQFSVSHLLQFPFFYYFNGDKLKYVEILNFLLFIV